MRLCADENVAPKITRIIRDHLLSGKHQLDTVDDHRARGIDDQIWVRSYAQAGGEVIIGGDGAMLRKPHEVVAISETKLRLVVFDEKWPRQKFHLQLSYVSYWWPYIEAALETSKPGQALKVPWSWNAERDVIKPVQVDLQAAYRKVRKQG